MKVSRTVAYALHAMLQLAQTDSENPVPCSQLACEGKMPERFLLQILRNLVTHNLLLSTRGVDGGYTLIHPPEEITLMDILDAFENGGKPRCTAVDARAALEMAIGIRESHRRGFTRVDLPLEDRALGILSAEVHGDELPARVRRMQANQ